VAHRAALREAFGEGPEVCIRCLGREAEPVIPGSFCPRPPICF